MTTQLAYFNKLLVIVAISFCSQAMANFCESKSEFDVMMYNQSDGYFLKKEKLQNIKCDEKVFEGKDFKIVNGTNDEPISFSDSPNLVKKAATTYYHLTLAKDYWVNHIGSERAKNLSQIVIRLEMTKKYSKVRHFLGKDESYNNAFTVLAGKTPRYVSEHEKKEWGDEIWFSPKDVIDVKEKLTTLGLNPVTQGLTLVEAPISDMAEANLIYDSLDKLIEPEYNSHQQYGDIIILNVGTILFIKAVTEASKYLDYALVQDEFYMDTALVPDVIYHEFTHIVLADHLKPTHSRPVIEGMADFFVAVQHKRTLLYDKGEDIIMIRSKHTDNEDLYSMDRELQQNAIRDFAVSVIWKIKTELDKANEDRTKQGLKPIVDVEQLVFEARTHLNHKSKIDPDLTRALEKACRKLCSSKRIGIHSINAALEAKGFN